MDKINNGIKFTFPVLLVMGAILGYPLIYNFYLSFHETSMYSQDMTYVGLKNFIKIIKDPLFWYSMSRTIIWTLLSVLLQFLGGLIGALILNTRVKGHSFFRMLILLPWAIPAIASSLIWGWLLHMDFGIINYLLKSIGFSPINWLGNPNINLYSVIVVEAWAAIPFVIMLLLAGLQAIPLDLYEVAEINGANSLQSFWYVTLPQLKGVIKVVLLLTIIWSLNSFTFVHVLTRGGPIHSTEILPLYIYFEGFQYYRFGKSSAGAIILFGITLIIVFVCLKVFKSED